MNADVQLIVRTVVSSDASEVHFLLFCFAVSSLILFVCLIDIFTYILGFHA